MILHRLGLINKDQRGFTLIELIVAVAITAAITGGIAVAIFQVFSISAQSNNHMLAARQVQTAGYWISHDAQMAQSVAPAADPDPDGFPLTLTWTEYGYGGDEHQVVYTLSGDSELKRSHSINGGGPSETIVAQYIDPDNTKCEFTGGELTLTVTAKVGSGSQEASETRVYEVIPRPSA